VTPSFLPPSLLPFFLPSFPPSFLLWHWGLNSGPTPWPFFCNGFFQYRVSQTILPGLVLNHDPPDLCF
jgi:hypothetical protein